MTVGPGLDADPAQAVTSAATHSSNEIQIRLCMCIPPCSVLERVLTGVFYSCYTIIQDNDPECKSQIHQSMSTLPRFLPLPCQNKKDRSKSGLLSYQNMMMNSGSAPFALAAVPGRIR